MRAGIVCNMDDYGIRLSACRAGYIAAGRSGVIGRPVVRLGRGIRIRPFTVAIIGRCSRAIIMIIPTAIPPRIILAGRIIPPGIPLGQKRPDRVILLRGRRAGIGGLVRPDSGDIRIHRAALSGEACLHETAVHRSRNAGEIQRIIVDPGDR